MKSLARLFVLNPLRDLIERPKGNIPALDAFRSLAVVLVIISRFSATLIKRGGAANRFGKLPLVTGGRVGVDLFFVLSGYLIGGQIWRELSKTGTVDMPRFLLRRGLRIWPLYFFFFVAVIFSLHRGESI